MAQRQLIVDDESILQLLIHYSDGKDIPLDSVLKGVGFSAVLGRLIGLEVESAKWHGPTIGTDGMRPLTVRYEGKKILTWANDGSTPEWRSTPDSPYKSS